MPAEKNDTIWKQLALFLLTILAITVCALLLRRFVTAIVGAVILAVVTERPYRWLAARIRRPSLCASVALILVVLAVIIPGFFLVQELGQQTFTGISILRGGGPQQRFSGFIADHPPLAAHIESFTDSIDINNAAQSVAAWIGRNFAIVIGGSVRIITQIVVMLFLLFFLFRDRALAVDMLRSLLPLRPDETEELLIRLRDTIYATALGRVTVALVQGVLAGLGFWVLDVPGAVFWATLTFALAMIPAFGAVLVWAPLALYLGLNGHWGKAALLAIWGGVIVSTIDNFLYPILVGTRIQTHTAIILLSILGGVALFGIPGILLGPVSFTVTATLLEFWRRRTHETAS